MTDTRKITYCAALNEALTEEMAHDPSILLVGNNISGGGKYGVTDKIVDRFRKNRVIDIPPAEATAVSFCLGLAMTGAKPVLELDGKYMLRAVDAIANEAAKTEIMYNRQFSSDMVIRIPVGYAPGNNVQTNQSWEGILASIPNITVVYPSTGAEAKGMLKAALRSEGITVMLENINYYEKLFTVPKEEFLVPLNKSEVKINGSDISVITYGPATKSAYEAIKKAAANGISCELIDLRTISPIDMTTITKSVSKTGRALIVHDSFTSGGIGAEISAQIASGEAFDYLDAPVRRVCGADRYVKYTQSGPDECVPDTSSVYRAIRELTDTEDE